MSISWESRVVASPTSTLSVETQEFSANPVINKKVKMAVSGLQRSTQTHFITDIANEHDKELKNGY
jgi:predicted YcjX-like family ATPase